MEGVSHGQGPVPDRDALADWPLHQGAGGGSRGERELALQAAAPLPPRGSGRARASVAAAQDLARRGSPTSTRTRSCGFERSLPTEASMRGPRRSTSTWPPRVARCPRSRPSTGCSWPVASSPPNPTSDPRAPGSASWPSSPTSAGRPTSPTSKWPTAWSIEVLNIIDDHSRLCVASRLFVTTRSPDVVRTLHKAAATWGYPQRVLDRQRPHLHHAAGLVVSGAMELELLRLGIETKHSRPYHPQTCGKVERFHQTLKKYLAKQEPATTKKLLQGQLNRFVEYYNTERPHRGLGRRRPIEAFGAREKAGPIGPRIEAGGYRIRHDKVDRGGFSHACATRASCTTSGWDAPTPVGGSSCWSPASTCGSSASTAHRCGI